MAVSILVFVELALGPQIAGRNAKHDGVSILVFVELALGLPNGRCITSAR